MLRPEDSIAIVPEITARVAHAAFPKGNVYIWLRDEIGQIYQDEDFADLYIERGQPGYSAWRLALICVMQFLEDLSDRQTADAVRGRIDWKYVLGLELEDSGFDHSVLSEFRTRLISGKAEQRLLDRLLTHLKQRGWIEERSKQRTDSTHVLSAIRNLNRLESVAEMLRAALNAIATVEPEWLQSWVPAGWYERYGRVIEDYHLPKKKSERTAYGEQVGQTASIHEALAQKSLLPSQHFVDSGYVDAELLVSSQQDYEIELIGPVRPDPSWQANQPEAYDCSRFSIDWKQQKVTCPQGHHSRSWTASLDRWNNQVITVNFGKKICRECPTRWLCTRSQIYPRSLTLHPQTHQEALQQSRQQQQTSEWKKIYHTRAGIEGTISQAVTAFGLRHNRYRGLPKTRLQHLATATAINLKRLWAWVQGVPLASTRTSHFASLNVQTI